MRDIVQRLLELQELEIVLAESTILHKQSGQAGADEVRLRIEGLRSELPEEHLTRYDKMRRNGLAVVREDDSICGGCRLHVPRGDLNRMHNGSVPWVCPNCARFLLLATTSDR